MNVTLKKKSALRRTEIHKRKLKEFHYFECHKVSLSKLLSIPNGRRYLTIPCRHQSAANKNISSRDKFVPQNIHVEGALSERSEKVAQIGVRPVSLSPGLHASLDQFQKEESQFSGPVQIAGDADQGSRVSSEVQIYILVNSLQQHGLQLYADQTTVIADWITSEYKQFFVTLARYLRFLAGGLSGTDGGGTFPIGGRERLAPAEELGQ